MADIVKLVRGVSKWDVYGVFIHRVTMSYLRNVEIRYIKYDSIFRFDD